MENWITLQAAGVGAVAGSVAGSLALWRGQPAHLHAMAAAINGGVVAAAYLGLRKTMIHPRSALPLVDYLPFEVPDIRRTRMEASMLAGLSMGLLIGAVQSRQLHTSCFAALAGGTVGCIAQHTTDYVDDLRITRALRREYADELKQAPKAKLVKSLETANRHPWMWAPFIAPESNDYRVHLNHALRDVYVEIAAIDAEIKALTPTKATEPASSDTDQ